jgi:hypothetical protein
MMGSEITVGPSAASRTKGSTYLGRSWGDYVRAVFQNSDLGGITTAAGWDSTPILFSVLT